jgi:hypothetical protein
MADTFPPHPVHGNTTRKVISNTNAGPYMGQVNELSFQAANMARNGVNPVRLKTHSDAGDVSVYRYGGNEIVNINRPSIKTVSIWDDTEYLVYEYTQYRGVVDGIDSYCGAVTVWNLDRGMIATNLGFTCPCSVTDPGYIKWKATTESLIRVAEHFDSPHYYPNAEITQISMVEEAMSYDQQYRNILNMVSNVSPSTGKGTYHAESPYADILPVPHDTLKYPDDGSSPLPWREGTHASCSLQDMVNNYPAHDAMWQSNDNVNWYSSDGYVVISSDDIVRHWFINWATNNDNEFSFPSSARKYNRNTGGAEYIAARISYEGKFEHFSIQASPWPVYSFPPANYEYVLLGREYNYRNLKYYGVYGLVSEQEYNVFSREAIYSHTDWNDRIHWWEEHGYSNRIEENFAADSNYGGSSHVHYPAHMNTNKASIVFSETKFRKVRETYRYEFQDYVTKLDLVEEYSARVHKIQIGVEFYAAGNAQTSPMPIVQNSTLEAAIDETLALSYTLNNVPYNHLKDPAYPLRGILYSTFSIQRKTHP